MQARMKAVGGEPVWLPWGEFSANGQPTQPPEHHLDMCKDIHVHMEKQNGFAERQSPQEKISHGHCNRQLHKPP